MTRRLECWFVLFTTLLLGTVLTLLGSIAFSRIETVRAAEVNTKARLVANGIAATISHAVTVGVPLDRLIGLEELVAARLQANPELVAIEVSDTQGRIILRPRQPLPEQIANASARVNGLEIAQVRVGLRPPNPLRIALPLLTACAALLLLGVVAANEAFRFLFRRGPLSRADAVRLMVAAVNAKSLDQVYRGSGQGVADPRLDWLASRIRAANERFVRVERLIASLRDTEPDADRRAELTQLQKETRGDARFAAAKPIAHRLDSLASDSRWLVFLAATAVGGLRGGGPVGGAAFAELLALLTGSLAGAAVLTGPLRQATASHLAGWGALLLTAALVLNSFVPHSAWVELTLRLFAGAGLAVLAVGAARAAAHGRDANLPACMAGMVAGLEVVGPLLGLVLEPLLHERSGLVLGAIALVAMFTALSVRAQHPAWRMPPPQYPPRTPLRLWAAILSGSVWGGATAVCLLLQRQPNYLQDWLVLMWLFLGPAAGCALTLGFGWRRWHWLALPLLLAAGVGLALGFSWSLPLAALAAGLSLAAGWSQRSQHWVEARYAGIDTIVAIAVLGTAFALARFGTPVFLGALAWTALALALALTTTYSTEGEP
ncbi:hypothetical protein [Chitinimonas lacunae]|uniref:Uncharacterized protein n=1 Tax=Chitinimonas lacunae TaxID=1963018 RepID=A0ABV8MSS6_9NEIS